MENQLPLISIIVPVYNVQDYVGKCLDSICGQSYRNLEIIVIDDGSTDNSPAICDSFAGKDSRIKVLHCKNGGQSAARNRGLDIAEGEFIGFVDSDDWIEADMYECLYTTLFQHKADISICSFFREEHQQSIPQYNSGKIHVWKSFDAIHEVIEDKRINNFMWALLCTRNIFENIRFPEGRIFEDIAISPLLYIKAKKIVYIERPLYHYRIRLISTVNSIYYDASKEYEIFRTIYERTAFLKTYNRTLWKESLNKTVQRAIHLINHISLDKANSEKNEQIVTSVREKVATLLKYTNVGLRLRVLFIMHNRELYSRLYCGFRRIFKSTKNFEKNS